MMSKLLPISTELIDAVKSQFETGAGINRVMKQELFEEKIKKNEIM